MSDHAECPCGVGACDISRASKDVTPFVFEDFINKSPDYLSQCLHQPTHSFDSDLTNYTIDEESTGEKSPRPGRLSRRRRFTQGLRTRAASLKTEFSFGKKNKSTSPSSTALSGCHSTQHHSESSFRRHRNKYSRESPWSTASSLTSSQSYFTTPSTTTNNSPRTPPPVMAARPSAGKLDPVAALRRRTITESKARTHKMAVDEERALRDRMRRNGNEERFPNYKFIDFIGKGTYGRVYQA